MSTRSEALRLGVGGPVGSGKTALVDSLCKRMRERFNIGVVTNDIYTREDQEFLIRSAALAPERIRGVETGGCPHTAIREDASMNLAAIDELNRDFDNLDLIIVESGGDNLAATFSPELSDLTLYVIDVSAGDKIPRKGGPGITKSDLLIINKIDLAPYVGASLEVMDRDARKMRGERPFVFTNLKTGQGLDEVIAFIVRQGMLTPSLAGWASAGGAAAVDAWFNVKQHPKGEAADLEIPGVPNAKFYEWIKGSGLEFDQLILEGVTRPDEPTSGWVHVSYRRGRNRRKAFLMADTGL